MKQRFKRKVKPLRNLNEVTQRRIPQPTFNPSIISPIQPNEGCKLFLTASLGLSKGTKALSKTD